MFNRWLGIVLLALMLSANAMLFVRDILPSWTVGDPPTPGPLSLERNAERWIQVGIFDHANRVIGRSWVRSSRKQGMAEAESNVFLEPIPLPNGMTTPHVRIYTSILYNIDHKELDEFKLFVFGLGFTVTIRGEMISDEFPCRWQVGELGGSTILNADATRAIGDAIRPFDRLDGLYVGRSWKMRVVNPLSVATQREAIEFDPVFVQVTRMERIEHQGEVVDTFRVETSHAVAWVAEDGRVLRQEVDLPLLGRLSIVDEPYDPIAYTAADRRLPKQFTE